MALLRTTCALFAGLLAKSVAAQGFPTVSLVSLRPTQELASVIRADDTATTYAIDCDADELCPNGALTLTQGPAMYAYATPTVTSGSTISTAASVAAMVRCDFDASEATCTTSYGASNGSLGSAVTTTLTGDSYPDFTGVVVTGGVSKLGSNTGGPLFTSAETSVNFSTVSVGSPPATGSRSSNISAGAVTSTVMSTFTPSAGGTSGAEGGNSTVTTAVVPSTPAAGEPTEGAASSTTTSQAAMSIGVPVFGSTAGGLLGLFLAFV